MTYSIGNRVPIPPKEWKEESFSSWAELFDEFDKFSEEEDLDFEKIRNMDIPHPQYFSTLYLQTKYEDFCRGADTPSILDATRSKDTAEEAEKKWEELRKSIRKAIKNMVDVMEQDGNKVDMTIQYLRYFCRPYEDDSGTRANTRFNHVLTLISGILLRTILQISTFPENRSGRMIANDLIKTFTRRLSRHLRKDIAAWIRIYEAIEKGEDLPEDEQKWLERELNDENSNGGEKWPMDREIFQELIDNDEKFSKAKDPLVPSYRRLLSHGIGVRDLKESRLTEIRHNLISKQFGKLAYNLVMLLIEKGWLEFRAGDFKSTSVVLGIPEEDMVSKGTFPTELFLSDMFYRVVHDLESDQKIPLERNNHPLFKYFSESRDRWSYVEPEPHIFDEKEDIEEITLTPPPEEDGKWTELDQLFADDQIDFKHPKRIQGLVRPRGYLTGTRKLLRTSGTTDEKSGGGYRILQRIISRNEEFNLLGSPAYDEDNKGHWYDLGRDPQTVGRERGVANKESVTALNHLQNTQWEINLHLLNAIAELKDKSGKKINIGQMLSGGTGFEQLRNVYHIELSEGIIRPDQKTQPELYREWMNLTLGTKLGDRAWVRKILALSDNVFWNVWTCDWRGRLMSRCALLSPQGADLDRALLRFKQWKPLGEKGWYWLKVYLFNLMKREWFEENKPRELEGYTKKCPFSDRAEFIEKQLKVDFFQEIAQNPLTPENLKKWQKKPGAKVESLQLLSAILEVTRIHEIHVEKSKPYEEIESGLPIALDASNNGYQHLAALLGKRELAEAVNVIPPKDTSIKDEQDLYSKAAEKAKEIHEHSIFSSCIEGFDAWGEEKKDKLIDGIFSRKFSKGITMTIAYGSKDLTGNFEGTPSNGTPKFLIKRYVYFDESTTCQEKDCEEKFGNEEDYEKHLEEHHYPSTKYYIVPVRREDIDRIPKEGNVNPDGRVPSGMIRIGAEDDFDTRRIKHIRNLNSGRYKRPEGGSRGTVDNPYPRIGIDLDDNDKIAITPTYDEVFYIEDYVMSSVPKEAITDEGNKIKLLNKTIKSIEKAYKSKDSNIQDCEQTFDLEDLQDLPQAEQIECLEKKRIDLFEERRKTIIENSTFHSLTYPGKYLPIWHENSLLYSLFKELKIPIPKPKNQSSITHSITQSFRSAIATVSGKAFNAAEKGLKHLVGNSAFNLATWSSPSGFRVRHIYLPKIEVRWGGEQKGAFTGYWGKKEFPATGKLFEKIIYFAYSEDEGGKMIDEIIREAFSFKVKDELGKDKDFERLEQIFSIIGIEEQDLPDYIERPYSKSREQTDEFYEEFLEQFNENKYKENVRRLLFEIIKKLGKIKPEQYIESEEEAKKSLMSFAGEAGLSDEELEALTKQMMDEQKERQEMFEELHRKLIVKTTMNPKRYLSELTENCKECNDEGLIKCPCVIERDKERRERRKELMDRKKTTVTDLKDILREKGEPTSGKKDELVERLMKMEDSTKGKEENECDKCKGTNLITCDDKKCDRGQIVKDYSRKEMLRGITPNFIHSLDAAHLTKVINTMCGEGDNPTSDFWAIHDCFGVHPGDTDRLQEVVNEKFVEIHTKPDGTHKKLSDWLIEMHPKWDKPEDFGIELPEPDKDFNIQDVNKSQYMIS
ncbi:MAG: DNA-directed RNA polymerase [Candidatus Thermoplasmatota archaeon]|nr:DNA-directed RNA polymerase [Candidatus Thermoplasmatota archaeon]